MFSQYQTWYYKSLGAPNLHSMVSLRVSPCPAPSMPLKDLIPITIVFHKSRSVCPEAQIETRHSLLPTVGLTFPCAYFASGSASSRTVGLAAWESLIIFLTYGSIRITANNMPWSLSEFQIITSEPHSGHSDGLNCVLHKWKKGSYVQVPQNVALFGQRIIQVVIKLK